MISLRYLNLVTIWNSLQGFQTSLDAFVLQAAPQTGSTRRGGEGRVPGEGLVHQSGPDWPRAVPLARAWTAVLRVLRDVLLLEGTAAAGGEAPGGPEVPHKDHRTMLWWNVSTTPHCWSVWKRSGFFCCCYSSVQNCLTAGHPVDGAAADETCYIYVHTSADILIFSVSWFWYWYQPISTDADKSGCAMNTLRLIWIVSPKLLNMCNANFYAFDDITKLYSRPEWSILLFT